MKNLLTALTFVILSAGNSTSLEAQDTNDSANKADTETTRTDSGKSKTKPDEAKLREWLSVQVLLDRAGFSPGELDGLQGQNSEKAISLFQEAAKLESNGELNDETSAALTAAVNLPEPLTEYTVTEDDMKGPFLPEIPKEMADQAKLEGLYYKDAWEMFGERFHTKPDVLKQLNAGRDPVANEAITVPNVEPVPLFSDAKMYKAAEKEVEGEEKSKSSDDTKFGDEKQSEEKASDSEKKSNDKDQDDSKTSEDQSKDKSSDLTNNEDTSSTTQALSTFPRKPEGKLTVTVSKKETQLTVTDEKDNVIFSAPVTTGSENDPLPLGEWKVNGTERYPSFNYNPDLFWDAEEGDKKAKIPAGPNGPVGVAWIDITKEHYGLHGTPEPGKIGYTESHGCVRLTNWDAMRLAKMVKKDTKVLFVE